MESYDHNDGMCAVNAGNPLLDISAVVDQALLDKYKVSASSLAVLYDVMFMYGY